MLVNFFQGLRDCGVPVTTRELLDLLEGMTRRIAFADMDEFYYFSRTCLVKDEKYFDRFDRAFGLHFKDLDRESQANLIKYMKKIERTNPDKVKELKKHIHGGQ